MSKKYFFKEDHTALLKKIEELEEEYRKWGIASTDGKLGDWHDNFMYEESQRQMKMISDRMHELKKLLYDIEIVSKTVGRRELLTIIIGSKVTLKGSDDESRKYFIGSYLIFRDEKYYDEYFVISYTSPLGSKLIGKKVNDFIELVINKEKNIFKIIDIQ